MYYKMCLVLEMCKYIWYNIEATQMGYPLICQNVMESYYNFKNVMVKGLKIYTPRIEEYFQKMYK